MAAMDYADMLELIQAARDGKTIQCFDNGHWKDLVHPSFDHKPLRQPGTGEPNYRIKPEVQKPREVWVNQYPSNLGSNCWETVEQAQANGSGAERRIRFREVLPEVDKLVVEALKAVANIEMEVKATDLVDDVTFAQVMAKKALEALGHETK